MTEQEFIQGIAIALCSNPKMIEGNDSKATVDKIYYLSKQIYKKYVEEGIVTFDIGTDYSTELNNIHEVLKNCCTGFDNLYEALQDIEVSIENLKED